MMLANQVGPRRWRLRAAGGSEIYGARPLPAEQRSLLAELTGAIRRLAATPQPWPPETISSVERRVAEVADGPGSDGGVPCVRITRSAIVQRSSPRRFAQPPMI